VNRFADIPRWWLGMTLLLSSPLALFGRGDGREIVVV